MAGMVPAHARADVVTEVSEVRAPGGQHPIGVAAFSPPPRPAAACGSRGRYRRAAGLQGRRIGRRGERVGHTTFGDLGSRANMVAVLRTILDHAVDVDELLPTNPAAKFGKKFFDGSSTDAGIHVEVYEEAEVAKILKLAAKDFPAYELYLRTLFYTGLRLGELVGLQWPDFDWTAGVVSIRRKVKVEKAQLVIERPKTGKFRDVDLPESLLTRWHEFESIRAAEAAVAGRAPSPWCCPSLSSPVMSPPTMSTWMSCVPSCVLPASRFSMWRTTRGSSTMGAAHMMSRKARGGRCRAPSGRCSSWPSSLEFQQPTAPQPPLTATSERKYL